MDNLCHTLAGAALGESGLKRQTGLGMATLMIASNIPDVDVAVFATDTLPMAFRRGWTHGVLAMMVLPALLAGLMFVLDRTVRRSRPGRQPVRLRGLFLLTCLATWLHVFMDFLNTYGVRLLMPFSDRWFYGDALYIVDPILYALFGGGVIWARVLAWRRRAPSFGAARIAMAAAAVYIGLMLASNTWARSVVRSGLERAGQPADTRFMVTPVFGNPVRREVLVDTGARYEKGFLWFEPRPHFRPAGYGVEINWTDAASVEAARTALVTAYLRWSRFPFFVVERTASATRVYVNDYRYSGPSAREGWAGIVAELPRRGQVE